MLATLVLAAMLWRLGVIDLRSGRLPDRLTLPLVAIGLILNAYIDQGLPVPAIAGAVAGFGTFWLIGTVYFTLRGVDGLGLGDAKLLAAGGAWLGVGDLPFLVLLAAAGALAHAVVLGGMRTGNLRRPLAFGPWLAAAFMVLWIVRAALLS